jgi:hypothetical protein
MSYFLNIYECEHEQISHLVKSGVKSEDFKTINDKTDTLHHSMLLKLFSNDYSRDPQTWESPDANGLIMALEEVCQFVSDDKTVIEFYLDEEHAPEMLTFCFNDWDVEDDFSLPISPDGTPAIIYRDNKSLNGYLSKFKEMLSSGDYDEEYLPEEELELLIEVISKAVAKNKGLLILKLLVLIIKPMQC